MQFAAMTAGYPRLPENMPTGSIGESVGASARAHSGVGTGPGPEFHTEVIPINRQPKRSYSDRSNDPTTQNASPRKTTTTSASVRKSRRRRRIRIALLVLTAALLDTGMKFAELQLGNELPLAVLAMTAVVSAILVLTGEWGRPRPRLGPGRRPSSCVPFRISAGTKPERLGQGEAA